MNKNLDPMKKIKMAKRIAALGFIVSIYLSIRWSDIPVINSLIFNNFIFVHKETVDSSMLNLVTGYFMGYLVYVLTVVFPTAYRNQVVNKATSHQLYNVLSQSKYLFFLMAKSAMNEVEWKCFLNHSSDFDCFDNTYFTAMSHFDITVDAESMLKHKGEDGNKVLKWYEYLEYKFENIYNDIDETITKYQSSMSEELFDCLNELKKSILFDILLGKSMADINKFYTDMDGFVFLENLPISMYCQQAQNKVAPIFAINHGVDGGKVLRQYINNLQRLEKNISAFLSAKEQKKDETIKMFIEYPKMGHIGTARLIVKEEA